MCRSVKGTRQCIDVRVNSVSVCRSEVSGSIWNIWK